MRRRLGPWGRREAGLELQQLCLRIGIQSGESKQAQERERERERERDREIEIERDRDREMQIEIIIHNEPIARFGLGSEVVRGSRTVLGARGGSGRDTLVRSSCCSELSIRGAPGNASQRSSSLLTRVLIRSWETFSGMIWSAKIVSEKAFEDNPPFKS